MVGTTKKRVSESAQSQEPHAKRVSQSSLDALKKLSIVVADTGDFEQLKAFNPQDATTNPTLLFQASQMPAYSKLLDQAIGNSRKLNLEGEALVEEICDQLAVAFGLEILKIVPGVVSTEVDACLSFDTKGSLAKAHKLIRLYEGAGVKRERILVKMASTWESCEAAKVLEKEGIHCNMTLLFSKVQAVAAANAKATLISPFVGRILDWHVKNSGKKVFTPEEDPGVQSVREIYRYYKTFGHKTIIMGASFRNTGEILALAGCDKLTISPALLGELAKITTEVECCLSKDMVGEDIQKIDLDEKKFRWLLNEDQMATEKLSEGIRNFNKDLTKLKDLIRSKLDVPNGVRRSEGKP